MQKCEFVRQCCLLQHRMDKLPLFATWERQVQCILYWILLCQCEPDPNLSVATATALLDQFEYMERASLLELAVWKAICIASSTSDERHDIHSLQAWIRHGWKTLKSEMRRTNEIHIIVTAVLPFVSENKRTSIPSPSTLCYYGHLLWPRCCRKRSHKTTTSTYRCDLCQLNFANEELFQFHIASYQHAGRIPQIFDSAKYPFNEKCSEMQVRIDALGLEAWKQSVQSFLYWILLYQEEPNEHFTMAAANVLLMKYEMMERISLLELVAWKVICILSADHMCDIYTVQSWICKGWKARKSKLRRDSRIGDIVTTVLPFLAKDNDDRHGA